MATVECPNGHSHELDDVPDGAGRVMWECPDCEVRSVVPGTEDNAPARTPVEDAPDGSRAVSDGDKGGGKERKR